MTDKKQRHLIWLLVVIALLVFGAFAMLFSDRWIPAASSAGDGWTHSTPKPSTTYTPNNQNDDSDTTPTPSASPTPDIAISWLHIDVEPSSVYFNEPIFVTVTSDSGGFFATLHWQGDGGLNNWINDDMQLWIDASTNTGTQEFIFSPEGQYTFTVSADDESASDTCYVMMPPY